MTFVHRAATFAAMTLSLTGLLSHSSPSIAAELDRVTPAVRPTPMPSLPASVSNGSTLVSVPSIDADPAMTMDDVIAAPEPQIFASLDAAVAAQDVATEDDTLRCLAGAIFYEAQGEPLAGQLAVAEVILNRTRSGRFPSDICSVITQRGQFGFVRGGTIPAIDSGRAGWKRAVAVAKVALRQAWNSPASAALYFNASGTRPGARAVRIAAIGNHVFYR